jgi:hypothetical protein
VWMKDCALIVMEPHDWLYPGERTTQSFRRAIADLPIELVMRGANLFCFAYDESVEDAALAAPIYIRSSVTRSKVAHARCEGAGLQRGMGPFSTAAFFSHVEARSHIRLG